MYRLQLIFLASLLLLLSACSSTSRLVRSPYGESLDSVPDPASRVFLLYQHGSQPEHMRDVCQPDSTLLPGAVPPVIANLSGTQLAGREVVVYALCSQVAGQWDAGDGSDLKVRRRVEEIHALLLRLQTLGVPARQIFLVGHSAGAWASLLLQREHPALFNAVIGFAPAFAGEKALRSDRWQGYFEQQRDELASAPRLDARIYAFAHDPYYEFRDLDFLRSVPGVELVSDAGDDCLRGHRAVFESCFTERFGPALQVYLALRLQDDVGQSTPNAAVAELSKAPQAPQAPAALEPKPCFLAEPVTGEATFYRADGRGNCSFSEFSDDMLVAAINTEDYNGAALCGACALVKGPQGTVEVAIVDRCPGCSKGGIDLSGAAFDAIAERRQGRVKVSWTLIPCETPGNMSLRFKRGSNDHWAAMQVREHRTPVTGMAYRRQEGGWVPMERKRYNYFVAPGGFGGEAVNFRITDIRGQSRETKPLPVMPGEELLTDVQFGGCEP